jgi:tetratricopeptide (TPR) repeat protein
MDAQDVPDDALQALLGEAALAVAQNDNSVASRAEVIYHGQRLLSLLPPGLIRKKNLEAIAQALYEQYESTGEFKMLEDALDLIGEAIQETDEDDDVAAARLGDLYSRCLRTRFMRGRNEVDLEYAIEFGKDSVERTENIEVDGKMELLVDRQNNLSLCYFTQAHQFDDLPHKVLEEAIDMAKSSMKLVAELGNPERLWLETANILGMCLQVRWTQSHEEQDIEESIELGYDVLDKCPDQPDARGEALSNLAFRMQRGYKHFLGSEVTHESRHLMKGKLLLDESLDLISQSMAIESERQLSKLENVMTYVQYIKEFPADIQVEVLAKCYPMLRDQVELMEQIAIMSNLDDRKDLLQTFYGISRYASAAAIESGLDPFDALKVLEVGRGLVMSIQYSYNKHPELDGIDHTVRDAYVTARKSLHEAIESQSSFHERFHCLTALQEARSKIRSYPGLEDFDKSLSRDVILELGNEGPIIVINVTDIRCHAIIIHQKNIRTVLLPDANEDILSERSWEIQQLLAKEDRLHDTSYEAYMKLSAFMKDLWKWIALPVLSDLAYNSAPQDSNSWPHVWWVLTGVLCLYPIHAAGVGLHSKKNNVMNRVISSYTPTLRALFQARTQYACLVAEKALSSKTETILSMLIKVITMPETPNRVSLEFAEREGNEISRLFPHAEIIANPPKERVIQTLTQDTAVIHFSCHGEVDYDFPWRSKILLRDWEEDPFTVQDVHELHLANRQNSQVAFLSACFTANAGVENLQDEMNHLVTALQTAGFMSIIGTFWDVQQRSAYEVVKFFYSELAGRDGDFDAKDVATVLHFAILRFRENTREVGNDMKGNPMIWGPFVSFGI